eukprot:9394981-Karenia_brevis.AAC.1
MMMMMCLGEGGLMISVVSVPSMIIVHSLMQTPAVAKVCYPRPAMHHQLSLMYRASSMGVEDP